MAAHCPVDEAQFRWSAVRGGCVMTTLTAVRTARGSSRAAFPSFRSVVPPG